jgi:Co/Zn/Cd efflux system component
MSRCCHDDQCASTQITNASRWRAALWIALGINASMFLAEIIAGLAAGSASLQADALDFLGDTANYAISLAVASLALTWRARAAFAKGLTLIALALCVIASTIWHAVFRTLPAAEVMGAVAVAAIIANGAVALMLYRFRRGDANMRSVWICSRNDVLGNLAVILAAAGVFGTGTGWPDIIVASIMALLGLSGGWTIVRHALQELRNHRGAAFALPAE